MSDFGKTTDVLKSRALEKERDEKRKELEQKKRKLEEASTTTSNLANINDRFQTFEQMNDAEGVSGIVTAEDLALIKKSQADDTEARKQQIQVENQRKDLERKKGRSLLSFGADDDDDVSFLPTKKTKTKKSTMKEQKIEVEETTTKILLKKDPTIETDFLPDKERADEETKLIAEFEAEWKAEQQKVRDEIIEIVYSYWDGTGHRRSVCVKKGTTIGGFLEACRRGLLDGFHELRVLNSDHLMYIKEDLIIPHHVTFYDLIVTKARGKSGPLFHFGVRDDVRLVGDARIETDESHAGKVVTRGWYERNKHIFPATRWEIFDPTVKRTQYTTHGDEVR